MGCIMKADGKESSPETTGENKGIETGPSQSEASEFNVDGE
jgi:hypothetical protein